MKQRTPEDVLKNIKVYKNIAKRAHYLANQMIFMANHRSDKEKGDPKVGGHSSASASALHIVGALQLFVRTGFDFIANKPHASPADHAYNYLLDLFLNKDMSRFGEQDAAQVMEKLRAFSQNGEPVFQSYHSVYDPDHFNYFPTGTVGIPPVQAGYLALAYRFAEQHGYKVPKNAHFWSIIGDSEFREGSLFEAIPDFAERELGNLTWIIDYNRQSLDGHRISNPEIMAGNDATRIEKTMRVNGWEVIQVRHGHKREKYFERKGGAEFKQWLEKDLTDYELQAMLLTDGKTALREHLQSDHKTIHEFLANVNDDELYEAIYDMGGHDLVALTDALIKSKKNPRKPCLIIAHTLKGWGLQMAAHPGNHSMLPTEEEMNELRSAQGLSAGTLFAPFEANTPEGKFCRERGDELYKDFQEQTQIKEENKKLFLKKATEFGDIPNSLDINLKMASYPHTQWMLGQLTSKLTRIANTSDVAANNKSKTLTDEEKQWKTASELIVTMAPDVGTSTNLNPSMDGKIFGVQVTDDVEMELGVKDDKMPDLIPGQEVADRFLRFEIAEANVMSCVGSFGRLRDILGIPMLPLMTVYDFFIKRALDQYFYDLYWKSSFILVGTPSGVTLSPEGAQHGWKSDFQIPNQITWEPYFCQELDWILCDAIKRHVTDDNEGRSGVLIRGVTRGIEQKTMLPLLRAQKRFKQDQATLLHPEGYALEGAVSEKEVPAVEDQFITSQLRQDVLSGGYYLIDYRGYAGYEPGDNVIHIFAMGALGHEAVTASQALLQKGIYANVIMVTSPDLLLGNLGHENDYAHLRNHLEVNSNLYLQPQLNGHLTSGELRTVAGRRIPIVSVHDGEPGLLDNIGALIGVRHEALAVRKHSRCGRPSDVYNYHGIDAPAVVDTCVRVLHETAEEQVQVSQRVLGEILETQNQDVPSPSFKKLHGSY